MIEAVKIAAQRIAAEKGISMGDAVSEIALGDPLECPTCPTDKPEGPHFAHLPAPCSWHDGTCEEANEDESSWCPCGRDGLTARRYIHGGPGMTLRGKEVIGMVTYRTEVTHEVETGETVLFVDAEARSHEALVTTIFEKGDGHSAPAINLVYVTKDESAEDQYGRQLLRESSVVHKSQQAAHGFYWTEAH